MKTRLLNLLFPIAALLLAGCAGLQSGAPDLEVTVEHVSSPQLQLFESRATVRIRIDNESPDPISLVGGVHHLRLNGHRVGKALDGEAIEIPPYASAVRELPLTIGNVGLLRTINESVNDHEVSYRLDSRLSRKTNAGAARTRSYRREGRVTLDELVPRNLHAQPAATDVAPIVPTPAPQAP